MSSISIGAGLAHGSDLSWLGAEGTPPPSFAAALSDHDGVAVITPGQTVVSITISESTDFDGTYSAPIADLMAGPVNLVAPQISGSGLSGTDITARAGLWVFEDLGSPPALTGQWLRDGVAISGQVSAIYSAQESDEGTSLSFEETASDPNGTRIAQSGSIIVAPPLELTLSDGVVDIVAGPTMLSIAISGTTYFDGTYDVETADLALGPVNLVRPALVGSADVGTTLSLREGLWVYEDTGSEPVIDYQWMRDAGVISGETASTYTIQSLDEGTSLSVIETATDTQGSNLAQTPGLAVIPATPPLAVSRVGAFQSSDIPTSSPIFTLDLSAYDTADQIIVFYGPSVYALSSTLGSMTGTKITTDGANSGASRMTAFAYTLTAAGSAAEQLNLTLPNSTNHHVISVHAVRGGEISEVVAVRNTSGAPQTLSVAPTQANNAILACAMGVSFMDAVFSWTGVTEIETANVPTASSRNVSIAQQSNVAVGPHSVTGTPSGTSHTGIIALAISET
jgi:hypothetical protein